MRLNGLAYLLLWGMLLSDTPGAANENQSLATYRAELDAFRKEHGGARELPDVRFFLFGMGHRTKLIYRDGRLLEAPTGKIVYEWKIKNDIIVPPDYLVALELADGGRVNIVEDETAVWIEQGGQRTAVEGTRAPVKLPTFAGQRWARVLRVLHQELLVNITAAGPVPNFFVYSKPWYRDGAMMALAFRETGNLDLIRDWILGLREPFDRNNAGVTEPDNLGQALFLVSLVSDKNHPLVSKVLAEVPRFKRDHYVVGKSDFGEHPVYQTKWLKFGLRALGLPDEYAIPRVADGYSALFWMDYRNAHVPGHDSDNRAAYPYLGWACDHFHGVKKSPIGNRDYPLTWEQNASQANYKALAALDPVYVAQKLSTPHTWHAAEVFLYALAFDPGLEPPVINTSPGPEYADEARDVNMVIGCDRTPGGRIWAAWVSGGDSELGYFVAATSDDDGKTWSKPRLIIAPKPTPKGLPRRTLVGNFWTDPTGRLWLFFDQAVGYFDGRGGDWAITCDNPDSPQPTWSEPRRIWHGATLNKPVVLKNGEWLLPVSLWGRGCINASTERQRKTVDPAIIPPTFRDQFHELDDQRMAHVFVSTDKGQTWTRRGGVLFPKSNFDEHMFVELRDGRLWLLARTSGGIAESYSSDQGRTWSEPKVRLCHVSARFHLRRLASGRLLLVKHGRIDERTKGRSHLTALLSEDDGATWIGGLVLDERNGISYPDGFQSPDGMIHIIYDHNRYTDAEILMAKFREEDIQAGKFQSLGAQAQMLVNQATGSSRRAQLFANPGKLLLSEDFAGPALPRNWQAGGRANCFTIVDGRLQGICPPDDGHGPSISVPVEGRNLTVQFSVKFVKPGLVLVLVDGESQFGGTAHLLRVALGNKFAALQQDRGSLESKQAQATEKAKAAKGGRKPAPPTKEQLADPKFYRTETLDRKPVEVTDGQWHRVQVEISGNEAVAQVDGVVLRATGTVWDVKKSRLVFLIGQAGTMQIDDVKIWENGRFVDWDERVAEDAKQDRTTIIFDGKTPDKMTCDTTLRELPDGSWIQFQLAGGDTEPSPKNYTGVTRSFDQGKTWTPLQLFDVGFPREGKTIGQGPTELMIRDGRCTLFFSTHSKHWANDWRSWYLTSDDSFKTSSKPQEVPGRLKERTFIRNHIVTRDGRIMLPFQHYIGPDAEQNKPPLERKFTNPRNGVLMSSDGGKSWIEYGNIRLTTNDRYFGWAENNLAELADGRIAMIIRADGLGGVLYYAESKDGGRTWPEFARKTDIPNPGSKATLYMLGGDTVALLHNPNPRHRSPLTLWISFDGLKTWPYRRVLVPESCDGPKGRLNYPDGFVSKDKQYLHFAFDDNRHRAVYYGAKLPPLGTDGKMR